MAKKVSATPRKRARIKEPEPGAYESVDAERTASNPAPVQDEPAPVPMAEDYAILRTNFKGTVRKPIVLSRLNAVCGGNRSGKTALRYAVEAAITGFLDGFTSAADWLELSDDGDTAFARLEVGASIAEYVVNRGAGAPKAATYTGLFTPLGDPSLRKLAIPSRLLQKFLVSDAKLRQQIFARFGSLKELPRPQMSAEQAKIWDETLTEKDVKAAIESAEYDVALSLLASRFSSLKTSLGREVGPLERALVEAETRTAEVRMGTEQLPVLREELVRARAHAVVAQSLAARRAQAEHERRGRAEKLLALKNRAEQYERDAEKLLADIAGHERASSERAVQREALKKEIAKLESEVSAGAELSGARVQRLKIIEELCVRLFEANEHACPIPGCDGSADPGERLAGVRELLHEAEAENRAAFAAFADKTGRLAAAKSRLAALQTAEVDAARATILAAERVALREKIAQNDTAIAELEQHKAAEVRDDAPVAHRPVEVIEQEIRELESGEALDRQAAELRRSIETKRAAQKVYKALETTTTGLLATLLEEVQSVAEAAVNRYAIGWKISLDLSNGCEWRIEDVTGRPRSRRTISGAERVSLLLALALAWSEGAPFRALLLDDEELGPFHSSPENLALLLDAVANAQRAGLLDLVLVCGIRADEVPNTFKKHEV